MTEEDFNKKQSKGEVKVVKPDKPKGKKDDNPIDTAQKFEDFIPILTSLQSPKRSIDSAPTFVPKTFADSIQFYQNGATYRVYFYVSNTWKYVTLT